jgi:hypothetical protein
MKRTGWYFALAVSASLSLFSQLGGAQGPPNKGQVRVPQSSVEHPADLGVRAHTHMMVMMPETGHFAGALQPKELPPFSGYFFETPASIACVYHLVQHPRNGCISAPGAGSSYGYRGK